MADRVGRRTSFATTCPWSTSSASRRLDDTGAQLLFRFVAAAYERRLIGIASHSPARILGTVPARAHHGGQHARPSPAQRPNRRHRRRLLPYETSPSERSNLTEDHLNFNEEWGLSVGYQWGSQRGQ